MLKENKRNKIMAMIMAMAVMLLLSGCGKNTLKGTYESVDGKYSIEFNSDKTCTWYQSGTFFEGSYEYDEDEEVYVLEIVGSGFYASTIFEAELEDGNLIVNGGACNDTVFEKQ